MNSGIHRIVGARWTCRINMLKIECGYCGGEFEHRSDRWRVRCPDCGEVGGLKQIRDDWVKKDGIKL